MNRKILGSLILAGFLFSTTNMVAEENGVIVKNENQVKVEDNQNEISSVNFDDSFNEDSLLNWVNDFESETNSNMGIQKDGKTFYFGTAIVKGNSLDASYPKNLTIAFEKAMLNLQADFILQSYGDFAVEKIQEEFTNDSDNRNKFDDKVVEDEIKQGKLNSILDKVVAVVENNLDAQLEKLGVPYEAVKNKTIEQKKLLYKDSFKKSMMKKAVEKISGLVPVQTKLVTVKTPNGNAIQIGVIAVISEKTIQFAKDMSLQRPTKVTGKAKDINSILPIKQEDFLDEFGMRYIYDENGRPMLLSYGRWSVTNENSDPAKYLKNIQRAQQKARMNAESYIVEFMRTNIEAARSAETEDIDEEMLKRVTDYDTTTGNINNQNTEKDKVEDLVDTYFSKIKAKSTAKLTGTSQIRTWKATDENGHLHVGSVVAWTYSQLDNVKAIDDLKNNIKQDKKEQHKEVKKDSSVVERKSKIVNETNDF